MAFLIFPFSFGCTFSFGDQKKKYQKEKSPLAVDPAKIYGRFAHAGQAGRHHHHTHSYGLYCLPRGLLTKGPRQRTGLDFHAGPTDAGVALLRRAAVLNRS